MRAVVIKRKPNNLGLLGRQCRERRPQPHAAARRIYQMIRQRPRVRLLGIFAVANYQAITTQLIDA